MQDEGVSFHWCNFAVFDLIDIYGEHQRLLELTQKTMKQVSVTNQCLRDFVQFQC